MKLIAHRGFAAENPENTLAAFRAAVAAGADAVELDVRRCGSGELVVCHDATVDRVTDGSGRVADLAHSELRSLSVLDSEDGIPTLAEVFEALPASVGVNVELKEPGTATDAVAMARRQPHEVLVSSFLPDALDDVRAALDGGPAADPGVECALLFADAPDRNLDLAVELDCEFVHPKLSLCLDDDRDAGDESDLVARAHERGLGVNAWTVETSAEARRLRDAGVDGVIADRSDVV